MQFTGMIVISFIFHQPMLELGAIDLLVTLTKKEDPALRLNGIWALMVRNTDSPVKHVADS